MYITKNVTEEIISRMKKLHLHQNVIDELKNSNQLNRSEAPLGSLYWLTKDEQEMVDTFERENENTIFGTHKRIIFWNFRSRTSRNI